MTTQCQSLCADDPSVRCSYPQGHGQLSLPNEDTFDELISCAHAAPDLGAYWDNGIPAGTSQTFTFVGDELDALVVLLSDRPEGVGILKLIQPDY